MSFTKQQLAAAALSEIGIASYVYDISPEMFNSVVQRENLMLANWAGTGINLQWPLDGRADPAIDIEALTPNSADLTIILNLACQIAPSFGKTVSIETKDNAKTSYENMLVNRMNPIPQMCLPGTMPVGAGNKYWCAISYPFFGSYSGWPSRKYWGN